MNKINERRIAFDILMKIKYKGKSCSGAIDEVFLKSNEDKQIRAFITDLVYGTIRNLIYIDYCLDTLLKKPIKKLNPKIALILELSAYQILFSDAVPVSAACNEGVKLTQELGFIKLKGFVNGVLRNLARKKEEIKLPDKKEYSKHLSVKYSIPEWIINIYIRTLGQEKIEDMVRSMKEKPTTYIRVNTSKLSAEELKIILEKENVNASIINEDTLTISNIDSLRKLPSFNDGLFYVQDLSSILAYSHIPIEKGDEILDMCAAPGGKSIGIALSSKKCNECKIVSRDVTDKKVNLIKQNIDRLKITEITPEIKDASVMYQEDIEKYNIVIVDVPCSGLGVIGRKPDITLNIKEESVKSLVEIQRSIINNAVKYVRNNGILVYSTCTVNSRENSENRDYILENNKFNLIYEKQYIPTKDEKKDGFYICIFRKSE